MKHAPGWEEVDEGTRTATCLHSRANCGAGLPSGVLGFAGVLQGESFKCKSQDGPMEQTLPPLLGSGLLPRKKVGVWQVHNQTEWIRLSPHTYHCPHVREKSRSR